MKDTENEQIMLIHNSRLLKNKDPVACKVKIKVLNKIKNNNKMDEGINK